MYGKVISDAFEGMMSLIGWLFFLAVLGGLSILGWIGYGLYLWLH